MAADFLAETRLVFPVPSGVIFCWGMTEETFRGKGEKASPYLECNFRKA